MTSFEAATNIECEPSPELWGGASVLPSQILAVDESGLIITDETGKEIRTSTY